MIHQIDNFFVFEKVNDSGSFTAIKCILDELVDNGFAICHNGEYRIDFNDIYHLSPVDMEILGFPPMYPYEIYVQSDGTLNQDKFRFKYNFYDFAPNGSLLRTSRIGPIVLVEEREYLLTKAQFAVCAALDEYNSLPDEEKSFPDNLRRFADVKGLAREAVVVLDSYLENENVHAPDKIKLDIRITNGILEILPALEDQNLNSNFQRAFDTFPKAQSVYPITTGTGDRMRVVLQDDLRDEIEKVKKTYRRISDPQLTKEVVDNPASHFDSDVVDVSVFYSPRVIELGIYKPKFYPFVCPYKTEWIPGIKVKDRVHGEKNIFFKSDTELNDFKRSVKNAVENNSKAVFWNDVEIPIDDAVKFSKIAKKHSASSAAEVVGTATEQEMVLIIEENAEWLGYDESGSVVVSELEHSFYQIDNLSSEISPKDHQKEGIAWLQSLYSKRVSGCLLADDMGLGKTLQLLYFFEWHASQSLAEKPCMVVAPVSLLENWRNEYQKFFTKCNLTVVHVTADFFKAKTYDEAIAQSLQKKQLLIVSYETLRTYQLTLCAINYSIVVLDEAQKAKTPGTIITNTVKALKAEFKVAMTGTPIENSLVDLWCLMDFAVPGLLGNAKDFAKDYQKPLRSPEVDIKALGETLRAKIGLLLKRRLKADVAKDLPVKYIQTIKRQMPPEQLERYKLELENARGYGSMLQQRNQILQSIFAIRDISDHPYLPDKQLSKYSSVALIKTSAKLQAVKDILERVRNQNEKAIIFADRKETQKMLQKVVWEEFEFLPKIINGDTPTLPNDSLNQLTRQQAIDSFQNETGFGVIVMSPLAAGFGLNVVAANHVIHYSRHWNPAKEEQATDRAYRIGQTKDVYVYYPMAVAEGLVTFDEVLDSLLSRKRLVASHALFPTEQVEIKPEELFTQAFNNNVTAAEIPITRSEISKLTASNFEAYTAAFYEKRGFEAILTPYANDKGADVMVFGEETDLLIQCKMTTGFVDLKAIQEIVGARAYYDLKWGKSFKLLVFTNAKLNSNACEFAIANKVSVVDADYLDAEADQYRITIKDLYECEKRRLRQV